MQTLNDKLTERFGTGHGITVGESEEFWTDVTIDQARTPLSDVLNHVMTNFPVSDVRIVEISMENVVRKVYDGALVMRGYLAVMRGSFMVGVVYRFGFLFSIIGNIIYLGCRLLICGKVFIDIPIPSAD